MIIMFSMGFLLGYAKCKEVVKEKERKEKLRLAITNKID